MPKEFETEFSIKEHNIESTFNIKENEPIDVKFSIDGGTRNHEELYNRDKADQHTISAITNLEERLTALENQDKTFVFVQDTPSANWVINHSLDKYTSIMIVDTAGNVQLPDEITYNSQTQITVSFLAEFAGKAYLN